MKYERRWLIHRSAAVSAAATFRIANTLNEGTNGREARLKNAAQAAETDVSEGHTANSEG
jgi:hypothetical protein